jgi:hypothetical protein
MVVMPFLEPPHQVTILSDVFVLMPFKAEFKPVYDDHITKVTDTLNLSAVRGDDFFTAHSIITDIWSAICSARIIIADCTGRNTNVFYELGLAHAVGKPVILITQYPEDVPFDIKHLRFIHYEFTPRGMKEFEATLANTITQVLDSLGSPRSPQSRQRLGLNALEKEAVVDEINGGVWTTCPKCNSRFRVKHGLRWAGQGYRHHGCGQQLRLVKRRVTS